MDRITIPAGIDAELREWLEGHPERHERAALVLFREYDRGTTNLPTSKRWVAADLILLGDDWILNSSACHIEINLRKTPEVYLRCELEGLELGFVHSHPSGAAQFSDKDESNERNILRGLGGCNRPDSPLISLILCDGQWIGRVRTADKPNLVNGVRHVISLGEHVRIQLPESGPDDDLRARQAAAFGKPFNERLRSLRVGVVGVGGTGSPTATLLARAGVGELVLVDGDDLERSNLNRVRGYRDADVGKKKAETLTTYINALKVGCAAIAIPKYLEDGCEAIDALSGCDIIFGCTDDVLGRELINLASHYYAIPLIDTGLTGRVLSTREGAELLDHRARISLIIPENSACLRCQRVVTDEKLKYADAVKLRPELKGLSRDRLLKEFYLVGGGEEAPGVGPFTSAAADFSVATLMNLIQPYRKLDSDLRPDNIWVDFVHLGFHSNEPMDSANCFCCGPNGIKAGDLEGHRLNLPLFKKL